MKYFIVTTLFSIILFAAEKPNPKAYEALGNEIYDNVEKIKKLKNVSKYTAFIDKIDTYAKKVKNTKDFGYAVASGDMSNVKLNYLQQLREHKKVNDYFNRSAANSFQASMKTKDNDLFIGIVNSGLINARAYKKKIMAYYSVHKDSINPKGIIQKFIDEDLAFKNRKRWKPKTKAQLQKEKVARLRKNDKLTKEALEKKLSDEVRIKKEKIRAKQEKELFN